jgi:hypothetical protein
LRSSQGFKEVNRYEQYLKNATLPEDFDDTFSIEVDLRSLKDFVRSRQTHFPKVFGEPLKALEKPEYARAI